MSEKTNWNLSMEEDDRRSNVSIVLQNFGRTPDKEVGTDESETMEDEVINRMINDTLNRRQINGPYLEVNEECNGNAAGILGVKKLAISTDGKMDQDQFIPMMQLAIDTAVKKAIKPLMDELKELKQLITTSKVTKLNEPESSHPPIWPDQRSKVSIAAPTITRKTENEKALSLAKRCVGFGPISSSTVNQHAEACNQSLDSHTKNQIGGAYAIRDFLCKEMGFNDYEADNIRIIRTFRIPNKEQDLFAELGNEEQLRKIRSRVSNLSNGKVNDPILSTYVPRHLKEQHSRLVNRANKGRAQTPKQSSKIWLGETDFELRFRPKGCFTPWNKVQPVEDVDPIPFIARQSLQNDRTLNISKPSPRTPIETLENPNLIPVSGTRVKGIFLGKTLLPRGVIMSNQFDPLNQQISSP